MRRIYFTYFSLPRMGDKPMMTDASADLTCWLASDTRSLMHGRMFVMMIVSRVSELRFWQNSLKKKIKIFLFYFIKNL